MTPEYWQKVKSILDRAVALPEGERDEFFAAACVGDDELRRDVESFLIFDDAGDDALENPGFSFAAYEEAAASNGSFIGKQIGRYLIAREIAQGGMGTVFLAERADGEFEQKVALKIIKRGMDSDAVLRRFLNERRILASLAHPNIARLLDGGTTDEGVPYFVMEYVEGVPITQYADENDLGIDERLRLFGEVAAAVSFAHKNLVIHRDLKPSNILVTRDGRPKLLDFGIAKLLTSGNGGMITATQQFVLTPDYASPEQVRGEQLTTATDVYSLGVILYELLARQRPHKIETTNFAEMIKVVCESHPPPPSRARPADSSRLRGDLDNIALRALKKEPDRRYSSVEQLNEDIRRHLKHLPIVAASDSWGYRTRKFVGRHRYTVLTAALIVISLVAGLAATLYQANIARGERAKAERRFNDVRQLANSFMFEINEKIDESPIRARELLVLRAVEYLDKLSRESEGDTDLQAELATAYEKIGQVQAELFKPNLGKTSDALLSHQKALQIRLNLLNTDPGNMARGRDVIRSRLMVGDIFSMIGRVSDARLEYEQAVGLGEQQLAADPETVENKIGLSRGYARLGQSVLRSGSLGLALDSYQRSLGLTRQLLAASPNDIQRKRALSVIYNYIGYVKMEMLELPEALQYFRDALDIDERVIAGDPNNIQYRGDLSNGELWLGIAMTESGQAREALVHLDRSLEIQKAFLAADPANIGYRNSIADCYIETAKALLATGDHAGAIVNLDEAMRDYDAVWQADPQDLNAKAQVLITQERMAEALTQKGNAKKGLAIYLQTIDEYEALISNDPNNTNWQNSLALCRLRTGENYLRSGDTAPARMQLQGAAALFQSLLTNSPENARLRRDLDETRSHLAKLD